MCGKLTHFHLDSIEGVPAMSRILTGDSQKLSFSILTTVPFLIFYQTNPLEAPTLPTQPVAKPVRGLPWQKLRVDGVCPHEKQFEISITQPNRMKLFQKWAPLLSCNYFPITFDEIYNKKVLEPVNKKASKIKDIDVNHRNDYHDNVKSSLNAF